VAFGLTPRQTGQATVGCNALPLVEAGKHFALPGKERKVKAEK
jgi:hypothetical protein